MPEGLAQAALQTANEALMLASQNQAHLQGHETACGRRYEDWRAQSARTEKSIEGINKLLWTMSGTTIVLLIGALGSLFMLLIAGHKSG